VDPDAGVKIGVRRDLDMLATVRLRMMRYEGSIPIAAEAKAEGKAPSDPLALALKPALLVIARKAADPDILVRRATLDFLESMEDAAAPAIPYLVAALGDPDLFIRWAAARTLGKVGPVETRLTVPPLGVLVRPGEDTDVRETAAITLQRFGPAARAALPDLIAGLRKGEEFALIAIMKAIISVGEDDAKLAVPALQRILRNPTAALRRTAAESLGYIGPNAVGAVGDLGALLSDDDATVREAASEAMVNITRPR
jgi:HEAT repeat protein